MTVFQWTPTFSALLVAAVAIAAYRFLVSPVTLVLCRWATPTSTIAFGPTGTASAAADGVQVTGRDRALAVGLGLPTVVASLALTVVGRLPEPGGLWRLVPFLLAMISWDFGTTDFDPRRGTKAQWLERLLLLISGLATLVWPLALFAWLAILSGRLRGWTHHSMMPVRLLKAYVAWYLATQILDTFWYSGTARGERPGLFLLLAVACLSHYLKPAWSKATLGPRWWSWAWENRTDFLIADAYNIGWARFVPERIVLRLLAALRPYIRLLNIGTMMVEASPLVAFTDRHVFVAVAAATVVFHVVIFIGSGVFFWESIATNAALAVAVVVLPKSDIDPAFGAWATVFAIVVMVLAIHELVWQPTHLGWWDSPFTTRIWWRVQTVSGRIFNLSNDFMCPFEREFGRWAGMFLIPEPVIGGASWGATLLDRGLRDRVRAAVGDLERLDELKSDYGTPQWDEQHGRDHVAFLVTMFKRLNAGATKGPLPRWLRWLKPPGGQVNRWGDLPRYRRTEPVRRIIISCEERCYVEKANKLVVLRERVLREIDVPVPDTFPVPDPAANRLAPPAGAGKQCGSGR